MVSLAALLGGLTMLGPFSIDAILPSLRDIERSLSLDAMTVQQVITAYLVPYSLMSLVHGPLSDAFGRRRVIICGLGVFLLSSICCAMATSLSALLASRICQGMSAGVGLIVGRAVIRDVLSGPDAQRLFTYVAMVFGIAPAIAPVIGGELLRWGWPSIFWLISAFSLVLLVITSVLLPETNVPERRVKLSVMGVLSTYGSMLKDRKFLLLSSATALNFAALWLYICSAPAFLMGSLGLSEREFGWLFIPMISGMVLGSFISGRLSHVLPQRRQIGIGFALCAFSMSLNILIAGNDRLLILPWAVMPMAINSFGISLVFPVITLAILEMFPAHRGSASSLQSFFSLALNSVVAGVISTLISSSPMLLAVVGSVLMVAAWVCWIFEGSEASLARPGK